MNTDKLIAAAVASGYAQTASRKVIALKKLDKRAKQLPKTISFVTGVAALALTAMGMYLGSGTDWWGVCWLLGFLLMGINPLVYQRLLDSSKKRYAWDIVVLAREIWLEETDIKQSI